MGVVRRAGFSSASAMHVALARAIHLHRIYLLDQKEQNRMAENTSQWVGSLSHPAKQTFYPQYYSQNNHAQPYNPNFYSPPFQYSAPMMAPAMPSYAYGGNQRQGSRPQGMPLAGAVPLVPPAHSYQLSYEAGGAVGRRVVPGRDPRVASNQNFRSRTMNNSAVGNLQAAPVRTFDAPNGHTYKDTSRML